MNDRASADVPENDFDDFNILCYRSGTAELLNTTVILMSHRLNVIYYKIMCNTCYIFCNIIIKYVTYFILTVF